MIFTGDLMNNDVFLRILASSTKNNCMVRLHFQFSTDNFSNDEL
jgi:hypothetical protein